MNRIKFLDLLSVDIVGNFENNKRGTTFEPFFIGFFSPHLVPPLVNNPICQVFNFFSKFMYTFEVLMRIDYILVV